MKELSELYGAQGSEAQHLSKDPGPESQPAAKKKSRPRSRPNPRKNDRRRPSSLTTQTEGHGPRK